MNFAFLMDPLKNIIVEKDTSFILMLGSHKKGHKVYFLPDGGITRRDGKLFFSVTEVVPQLTKDKPFITKKSMILSEDNVDVIFIRNDPPFDPQYLMNTWLLDLAPESIKIINRPSGIRTVNEKIWASQFTSIIPRTLIGRNKDELLKFLTEEKDIVAKPTDGFGGQSIFRIQNGDLNANVILETLTKRWSCDIILQPFLLDSEEGDKRILLLNGDPLGAVLRLHKEGDHRNNFFAGGKPVTTEITDRDYEIINILKPELQRLGLTFVGIDVIGEYLIEVNVTSPTCLQEMNRLYAQQLEDKVIEFAEKKLAHV